jgi:pre-mRNA-splicing helicase BRR2
MFRIAADRHEAAEKHIKARKINLTVYAYMDIIEATQDVEGLRTELPSSDCQKLDRFMPAVQTCLGHQDIVCNAADIILKTSTKPRRDT